MDRARVSQSIILTVIMILGALSYSINDLSVLNNELNEKESVAHSASNNTYDPLAIQTSYYDGSENPGYIGTTYDDRVIVYSEEQDSRGDFNIAISVYSYPDQGFEEPAGRSPLAIQIPEMNMDREILLPTNFSRMRPCTPILHPDDSFPSPVRMSKITVCHTTIHFAWISILQTIRSPTEAVQFSFGMQMIR